MKTKDVILDLRKKYGLSQEEMAQKLFVTRQAVSRWETGETMPNIETLRLISRIFDISINTLVDESILTDIENDKLNADRFLGFAELYENSRPIVPEQMCSFLLDYLEKKPLQIVDLGCGTGLSTLAWKNKCDSIIGIDPSRDMLDIAEQKRAENIQFKQAYSDNTDLPDDFADIVICSQSFHWMNPIDTLREVDRILKKGGIFATVDCDWPPVTNWKAEAEYSVLLNKVRMIESEQVEIKKTFHRWEKEYHLKNIRESGYFRYCREIVFANKEKCNADRFFGIALSQGGLQAILKTQPEIIKSDILHFQNKINEIYGDDEFDITFCYRMRVGIK